MNEKVERLIQKKKLLHHGATVLAGVSGGPDSLALLRLLTEIREQWNLQIIVLTIDHGLRGESSKEDTLYVKRICEEWGIKCIETFLDVPSYKKKHGLGTQLAAREMRYAFFEEKMQDFQADYLALGHHADDQTETILMRLVRTTNPKALAGIQTKRKFSTGFIVRPLITISKQEIEAYLEEKGISPRRDPSNLEDAYTRNYIRLHVIPHLKAQNPKLNEHFQRLSENWLEDEIYLESQAEKILEETVEFNKDKTSAVVEIEAFSGFSFALQRRAFHLILNYLYRDIPSGVNHIHEDLFFDLLCSQSPNASVDFPAELSLIRTYHQLMIRFPQPQPVPFHYELNITGKLALPNGSVFHTSVEEARGQESRFVFYLDASGVELPLYVRTRRPGDRMSLKGMQGSKKLKDIFIDEKIPTNERDQWPVVVDSQNRIIWLAGLKKGSIEEKANPKEFIKIYYQKNEGV